MARRRPGQDADGEAHDEELGLPQAFSGHKGYGEWDLPPGSAPVLAVGVAPTLLEQACRELRSEGELVNAFGVDNQENGTSLSYCVPSKPWLELWPRFRHLG